MSINIKDEKLEKEIDNIFNSIENEVCYIYIDPPAIAVSIVGMGDAADVSDFSSLIPNLFRVCYAQVNAVTPYICPSYKNPTNSVNYFPVLINANLIKSFLYFNFPGNIKYFNNNYNYIDSIYKYRNYKNIPMTNSWFTPSPDIVVNTYGKNSLLIRLLRLNSYMSDCYNANINHTLINNYIIDWDFTKSCVKYSVIEQATIYTIGNFSKNEIIISQEDGGTLYAMRNSILYLYKNDSTNTNGLIVLQKYSIFTVLEYASEVYEDICQEIKFFFENKIYCKKSYMYTYNIPVLLKIYKNYYNNQIYTISKSLTSSNPYTVIPSVISITTYVNQFISIYSSTYPSRYLIKTLYLNSGIDAIVIYNTLGPNWGSVPENTLIYYWYYYINIGYPSAIELFNINNLTTGNYSSLNTFTSNYNSSYTSKYSYTVSKQTEYTSYGLYSDAGDISLGTNVNAIVFDFVDSSNVVQSILFETLQSPITNYSMSGGDYGVDVPGLVLQYYQKV